ncbi:GTP cyclohydrolase II [Coemansia sp. RSA 1813]|nr:GTP cyclohydrolase II [Coemansia sp. RSA 1646]KAJ1765490.1 GTP cyclohydrolase II [Coemansia sp. RSA 1843]KAJ2212732.1 GTP cyclohydrolase II [Coemansia sp. RSA 487]KAJ2567471.1 GTP cyclohydrolase II [Coemansia sp. RSA 1813]
MPSPNRLPFDLDSSTAVPSTPFERVDAPAVATPVEGGSSMDTHFNASLDKALLILRHKETVSRDERGERGSATPMSWSSSTATLGARSSYRDVSPPQAADKTPDDMARAADRSPSTDDATTKTLKGTTKQESAATAAAVVDKDVSAECQVRARIPYPGGHFYLHLYHTDEDDKEHLAIVFGDDIRSETLEQARVGESDMDRKTRGASTGALRRMVGQEIAHRNDTQVEAMEEEEEEEEEHPMGFFEPDQADLFAAPRVSIVEAPLVRVHSECFTGETVSSVRCDCGYQLAEAMREIQREGRGVIVYLRQEGRGIGLLEKLKAYNLQDMGHDTVDANLLLNHPADARTYGAARAILADLGVSRLRLLTNNADKIRQLCDGDTRLGASRLQVICHVPMYPRWWDAAVDDKRFQKDSEASQLSYARHLALKKGVMVEADRYLRTKAERMGHMLPLNASLALPGIVKPHVSATASLYLNH